MNLIVGDSHVHFAFDFECQTIATDCIRLIKTDDWLGLSHRDGLTIWSATKNMESELLEHNVDIGSCENVVYIFGSNDALVKRENGKKPKEFMGAYIKSIDDLRVKYGMKNAYVIAPHHIRDLSNLEYWDPVREQLNDFETSNNMIKDIAKAIKTETKKYKHVHMVDITNLFNEDGDPFNEKYSLDGMHFNEIGKLLFFSKLEQAMSL